MKAAILALILAVAAPAANAEPAQTWAGGTVITILPGAYVHPDIRWHYRTPQEVRKLCGDWRAVACIHAPLRMAFLPHPRFYGRAVDACLKLHESSHYIEHLAGRARNQAHRGWTPCRKGNGR